MGNFGYNSYKGRGGGRKFLILLLVVLCVAVSVFIYVAVSDGLNDLVRDTQTQPPPTLLESAPPTQAPVLIVETATPSPTPTPTPSPPTMPRVMSAYHIDDIAEFLQVATAVQLALAGEINTVVVRMKDDRGNLAYASQLAPEFAADITPLSHLDELRDAGLYLVAEVYAFEDSLASDLHREWSVATRNGTRWLDWQYHGWLNPKTAEARQYILEVSREVLALGFDKILYQSFEFPSRGRPELLYYADETPEADVISAFKDELNDTLGDVFLYDAPAYVEK